MSSCLLCSLKNTSTWNISASTWSAKNPGQTHVRTIKRSSRDALVQHSPQVNMVTYEEHFEPFFCEETPVTHLYFGRTVSKEILGRIGLNCPRLVELVVCAERCKSLTAILTGEREVTCGGFVELVKVCGGRLTQLSITEEGLTPDSTFSVEQIHSEVSKHLGRMWFPDIIW